MRGRPRIVGKPGTIQCHLNVISNEKSAYGEVFPEGVILFRVTLEELSARDRGCRFGLLGCGGLCWLGRGLLGLGLLGLISLLLDSADLHAAFQDCSILYADPVGYHIASASLRCEYPDGPCTGCCPAPRR